MRERPLIPRHRFVYRLVTSDGQMKGAALVSGKPTVSVLIAAYNASTFLHRAVRSALAQTYAPLEILIIDDASTDNTLAIANALTADDSRVRVLTLPFNSGPAAARNAGLNAARGDWIAILDADDAYTPSRLEALTSAQNGKHIDIVFDNFFFFDATRGIVESTALPAGDAIEPIDVYDFVEHARPYAGQTDWGLLKPMFRRAFLEAHSLRYPEFSRHGEDFLFMCRALHAGGRCLLVHTPGYLYSTRSSGMSRTTIDHGLMIEHIKTLLNDPSVRADVRLSRLVSQCITDQKRLHAELQLWDAKEKKDYRRLALLLVTNMRLSGVVAKTVYRKVKRSMFRM
jgi:succinoglycan biosynthesis protein ExoO